MTTIALADDHHLIRNALVELINKFDGFKVIFDVANGQEFVEHLKFNDAPDIALIDINMPEMNGFQNYPTIKTLALSIEDNEESIIHMLRCGAIGYLLKDTETLDFKTALEEVKSKGYYHSELVSNTLLKSLQKPNGVAHKSEIYFQAREQEFLEFACSELTYKEIADKMCLSPRTIDGYRENLFIKFELKSRVGLVLFALRNGLIQL
jgi:two-component system, NarL family, invasion response regulator UvrY